MTKANIATARETRQRYANDPHRPGYHFQPPSNWMNDPNGLIQWKGRYHLFYQHNPYGPLHANMHWGHAVSDDLVHWQDLPIALTPTPGAPDKDGCWSGCAVDNNGVPTLIYTGVRPETQCIAIGSDDMLHWEKYDGNPVIPAPPEDLEVTGFRDPCVWREDDVWYTVIGSGIKDVGGTVLLYRSTDLVNWEYMHPIFVGDKDETGTMWECPSFFPLGDKHVLFVSVYWPHAYNHDNVEYFVGTYKDYKFEPEYHARLDHSSLFYAPQSIFDESGRRLMFGWLREARSDDAIQAAGWAGTQSVPRVLSLRADGLLGIEPGPELQALREKHDRFSGLIVKPGSIGMLSGVKGNALEIIAEFEPGSASEFGLKLCCSPGGEEQTIVVYDRVGHTLTVDRTESCANPEGVDCAPQSGSITLAEDGTLRLHIFLDHSTVEVFANGHECLTSRIYPTREDSLGVDVFARGGDVTLKQMDIWQLASIWDLSQ